MMLMVKLGLWNAVGSQSDEKEDNNLHQQLLQSSKL